LSRFVKEKNDISGHIMMSHFQYFTLMVYNLRPYFTQLLIYLQLWGLSHCLDINSHNPSLQTGPQRTLWIMFCHWDVCWGGRRVLCGTQMERWRTDGRGGEVWRV